MFKKTRKQKRNRYRTLRRKSKRGGGIINTNPDSQRITIPTSSFRIASVNSTDIMSGISKV